MEIIKPYFIYKHTNLVNGKVYIGQTSNAPEIRWNHGYGYLYKDKNGKYFQPYFARAILKYGWDNFSHEVVAYVFSSDDADELEKKLIKEYDSTNPQKGYNILDGGGSHRGHSINRGANNPRARKVAQYTKDGELIRVWDYMGQACNEIGVDSSSISKCCRGTSKTHKGYVWRYFEDM